MNRDFLEVVLQNEVITFHNGLTARIQILEESYRITLELDTEAHSYPDGILNMAKPGIKVSSKLIQRPKTRFKEKFVVERSLDSMDMFKEDVISPFHKVFNVTITVRLCDIARSDIKNYFKEMFERREDDLK